MANLLTSQMTELHSVSVAQAPKYAVLRYLEIRNFESWAAKFIISYKTAANQ